jgi:hypothetical protein
MSIIAHDILHEHQFEFNLINTSDSHDSWNIISHGEMLNIKQRSSTELCLADLPILSLSLISGDHIEFLDINSSCGSCSMGTDENKEFLCGIL